MTKKKTTTKKVKQPETFRKNEIPFWDRIISKVAEPEEAQDVATKNYVDTHGGSGSTYTAGENITIENNVISATDTTYSAGDNISISDANVISATDTTYSDFTGTDGTSAGVAGLVPAPATTDAGKYLKADGTWDTVSAGPTVVQTTGTSQTDVMSQNAVTSQLMKIVGGVPKPNLLQINGNINNSSTWGGTAINGTTGANANGCISIGAASNSTNGGASAQGSSSIAIGAYASTADPATYSVAIGRDSTTSNTESVAIGYQATTTRNYEFSVGKSGATRFIANVTNPTLAQDAATKNYVDSIYPVGAVFTSTSATTPTIAGGTWTDIGTQTIGTSTVHYYERTA